MKELESLLKAADVKPPYLAVSHSYGAVITGLWACKNKYDIIGMVLLDPALGDCASFTFIPEEMHKSYTRKMMLEGTPAEFSKKSAGAQTAANPFRKHASPCIVIRRTD